MVTKATDAPNHWGLCTRLCGAAEEVEGVEEAEGAAVVATKCWPRYIFSMISVVDVFDEYLIL